MVLQNIKQYSDMTAKNVSLWFYNAYYLLYWHPTSHFWLSDFEGLCVWFFEWTRLLCTTHTCPSSFCSANWTSWRLFKDIEFNQLQVRSIIKAMFYAVVSTNIAPNLPESISFCWSTRVKSFYWIWVSKLERAEIKAHFCARGCTLLVSGTFLHVHLPR